MPYTHTTYLQFRNLILARLGDLVFYTDAEIKRYALETLRTWNALAQFSRDRGTFNTVANQHWYDINLSLLNAAVPILGYTLSPQDLLVDIKCALMEDMVALSPTTYNGTEQFTQQDITDAITAARNEFILRSAISVVHYAPNVPAPPASRVFLDDAIIEVLRASFLSNVANSKYFPLSRADERTANSYIPNWNLNADTPLAYSLYASPRPSLQLIPISNNGGILDLLTISTTIPITASALFGSSPNPADLVAFSPIDVNAPDAVSSVVLGIPDDFVWGLKWKVLAYLMSKDGESTDAARYQYCQQRYEESLIAAHASSTLQNCFINDTSIISTSIETMDKYNRTWQSITGQPNMLMEAGRNLVAFSPVPDAAYGVVMDVVRKFPVPTADGDFIQVGREHINVLVDYAVHLALFKQGGAEFFSSMQLKENLVQMAMEHNMRLKAEAKNFELLRGKTQRQEIETPIYSQLAMQA